MTARKPESSAIPPVAGPATAAGHSAVAKPGTPPSLPGDGRGVPGCPSSPPGQQHGEEGPQTSGGGVSDKGASSAGLQAWKAALAKHARDKRNRRGRRPGPPVVGVRAAQPRGGDQ